MTATVNRANGSFCLLCAFKHVAVARAVIGEMMTDWNDVVHLARAVGNLACAEDHLLDRPGLARRVRAFRIRWVERVFDGSGGPVTPAPDIESIVDMYEAIAGILEDLLSELRFEGELPEETHHGKEGVA